MEPPVRRGLGLLQRNALAGDRQGDQKVRGLDFSHRPWDNGYSPPVDPGDSSEQHPYHFCNPIVRLKDVAGDPGTLGWKPGKAAIIVNEYGWLWLNRDGTPTTLTRQLYKNLLGAQLDDRPAAAPLRPLLGRGNGTLAIAPRLAAVLHFCGLSYSRPDGQTSDHWADVEKLVWDPDFYKYVRDAFAPVGIMIDAWAEEYPPGKAHDFPVAVINDLYENWQGTVRFRLSRDGEVVEEKSRPLAVAALGREKLTFAVGVPNRPGRYQLEAALLAPGGEPVRSLRDFRILSDAERLAPRSLATGKPVKASSNLAEAGATSPAAAVDGRSDTRWSSKWSDPQWIAVDLEKVERISRVELAWEAAYAKAYSIEVSLDGKTWKEVYRTQDGQGGNRSDPLCPRRRPLGADDGNPARHAVRILAVGVERVSLNPAWAMRLARRLNIATMCVYSTPPEQGRRRGFRPGPLANSGVAALDKPSSADQNDLRPTCR